MPGYTLAPLYAWGIGYYTVNFQSTTGNGPIIKQLYFRRALAYLMNQSEVTQLQSNAASIGIKLNLVPKPFNQLGSVAGNLKGALPQSPTLSINPENWYFVK